MVTFKDIELVKKIINNDGVIAFPTETVYGLGIRYNSFLAYSKIFELKHRSTNKPLTLMLYDINDIKKFVVIDNKINRVIKELMPGALTIVLPIKEEQEIIGVKDFLGIRIPDDKKLLNFLKDIEVPMFVTSANISDNDDLTTYDEVYEVFNNEVDVIINEDLPKSRASTVIKIDDGAIQLLRQGPIELETIERVFNSE